MSEKKKAKRGRWYLTGLRFLIAFACFLFTVSVFYPFLQCTRAPYNPPWIEFLSEYLWSFKGTIVYERPTIGLVVQDFWFETYWSGYNPPFNYMSFEGLQTRNALKLMLGAQVFAVLFAAVASINLSGGWTHESWTPNPHLLLASTALTVVVMSCMWFVCNAFDPLYVKQSEAGFWLSLLSVTLFFAAFLLSWKQP